MLDSEIKFSIIVPAYNASTTIVACIQSITSQTLSNIEVIVVDDCSTDNTLELVGNMSIDDCRVKKYKTVSNYGGPAGPRNFGIGKAGGRYIAFCDADDIWSPQKLEIQYFLMKKSQASLVCSQVKIFKDLKEVLDFEVFDPADVDFHNLTYAQLLKKDKIATSTCIIDTKYISKERLIFNEDKKYIAVEDYDLWLSLIENNRIKVISVRAVLCFYRQNGAGISSQKIAHSKKVIYMLNQHLKKRKVPFKGLMMLWIVANYILISLVERLKKDRF